MKRSALPYGTPRYSHVLPASLPPMAPCVTVALQSGLDAVAGYMTAPASPPELLEPPQATPHQAITAARTRPSALARAGLCCTPCFFFMRASLQYGPG